MRVLAFHGVVDGASETNHFSSLFADIKIFEEQAALLRRRGRPVSLTELEASLSGGPCLPADAVHVSFDDGFRNNLRAAEILDRYRIPWSLFVVVDAVLDGYRPWFIRLADAIEATSNVLLADGSVFEMTDPARKREFARRAKVEIMAAPGADHDAVVDRLLALAGMRCPLETSWPLLDADDLRELHRAGVEIGNHSARHRDLTRCPESDLAAEINTSKGRLEGALASPVRWFAYPDGRHDRRVRRMVGRQHTLGLATWTWHQPERELAVRRYEPIDTDDISAILDAPEPSYGVRWARWNLPSRAREARLRVHQSFGRTLS
jgi:peptidoglycan/xylan/chitin deacetylase (PgdA/CDA1 family)